MANEIVKHPLSGSTDLFMSDNNNDYVGVCAVGHDPYDIGRTSTSGAVRIPGVTIAQGASLNFCYLIYKYVDVGSANSGSWKFNVHGIDEDNTAAFNTGSPLGRAETSALISVDEGKPTAGGTKSFNVKSIVEEIVGRNNWSSGNHIGITFKNNSSDNDVGASTTESNCYLVWRVSAEPDFTPTPVIKSTPTLPSVDSYGIKISKPGENVLTATEANLYFSTKKKIFKVYQEAEITMASAVYTVTHNLGYVPYAEAFVQSGNYRTRLPNISFTSNVPSGYLEITTTQLKIRATNGVKVYYYIFLDEMAT